MAGSDEYCTPEYIIRAAKSVIGRGFDFDPATNDFAQKYIGAAVHRAISDEGTGRDSLSMDWTCFNTIWLNPPYSFPKVQHFAGKFEEWATTVGADKHGFVLVNSKTETYWYQSLLRACDCCCFFDHRISFVLNGKAMKQIRQMQTLFYYGTAAAAFFRAFRQYGFCCLL